MFLEKLAKDGIFATIKGIVKPITDLIDNLHTSDEEKGNIRIALTQLENTITLAFVDLQKAAIEAQAKIILAEAQGGWLQRNWRPLLMVISIVIIANNYVIVPYLSIWTDKVKVLELPGGLWALLTAGVGGYVIGRSVEKREKIKTLNGKEK